jgi:O-antigen ligase
LLAVLFGHGFDLHRLYWPALFAGTGTLLLAVSSRGRLSDFPWTGFTILALGLVYFLVRAWLSPVYDLGRLDVPLICGFGLAVMVGAAKPDWRLVALTVAAVAVGHIAVGCYQQFVDGGFALFRGDRADQIGVSGLYFHRNYLAGFLELFLPFWGAMLIGRRGVTPWATAVQAIVLILAAGLLVLTASRGGLAAAGIGFFFAMATVAIMRWRTGNSESRGKVIALGGVFAVLFAVVLVFLLNVLFQSRGRGSNVADGFTGEGRLGMAGMAYEQWLKSPVLGSGSRSYSYESISNWDYSRMPVYMGTPNMAHNDYLQVLTDYGAVGLGLILALAAWIGWFAIKRVFITRKDRRRPGDSWIPAAVVGVLAAALFHGLVDFNLHILPNIMLFGLIVGMLPGLVARKNHTIDKSGWSRLKGPAFAMIAGGLALSWVFSGWHEIKALPTFIELEREIFADNETDERVREIYRKASQEAPSYQLASTYGALELERATKDSSTGLIEELGVTEAIAAYELALERHPWDGESLLNYATALEFADRVEDAENAYQRAVNVLWKRENHYGAMKLFSFHLARRGETFWDARNPEPALGFFELAKEYLEESWRLNHRPDSFQMHQNDVEWLEKRIVFLRENKVDPIPLPEIARPPSLAALH